ncbi:MFS transporter [Amycolatopsis sp. NPDC003676]
MAISYRRLAALPHLPALMAWSQAGRLYLASTGIAVSFLVARWTSSYAIAGAVGGALALGQAVAGPLHGRAADRGPVYRVLVRTSTRYAAGLTAMAVLPALLGAPAWPLLVVLALVTGVFLPPVTQISRMVWPRVSKGADTEALYSLDASFQEVNYVIGPVLTSAAVAVWSPSVALVAIAAVAVLGSCGFARVLRRTSLDLPLTSAPGTTRHRRLPLANRNMLVCLAAALALVIALYSTDLLIVAWARNQNAPLLAGVLGAVWAIGSLIGGLYVGRLAGRPLLTLRLALAAVGIAALVAVLPPVLMPSSPVLVAAVLMMGGTAVAPSLAAITSRVGEQVPEDRKGEAFGWLATAVTSGTTIALPLSGVVLDQHGPAAAAGAAAVFAALAALISVFLRGTP